jgi:AcrR family transcriptional regulator
MRADAQKNRAHVLEVAGTVFAQQGLGVSMRDIARRAEVGLATLLRHFPTRDALLEALFRTALDGLTRRAAELEASNGPDDALISWLREAVRFLRSYGEVGDMMAAALEDSTSALHASCEELRQAGARLLVRAQSEGNARTDMKPNDILALVGAVGWVGDQPAFAARTDYLFDLISDAIIHAKRPG